MPTRNFCVTVKTKFAYSHAQMKFTVHVESQFSHTPRPQKYGYMAR